MKHCPTIDASLGVGMVGGVKATFIALLAVLLCAGCTTPLPTLPTDFKSLKALAEKGDAKAQNNLGVMYDFGRGVKQDFKEAVKWYRNYLPSVRHAQQAIGGGQIGDPYAIHVDFYFAKDSGPPKGSRGADEPIINWLDHQISAHATGANGGVGREPMGELKIEGVYPLGYIQMLLGARVKRVFARTTAHFHQVNVDHDVEDLATVTLEMERDILGTLCIGRIGAAGHPDIGEIKIHVLGSKGALGISEARPEVAIYYRGQSVEEFRHRRVGVDNDNLLMQNFAEAIDQDGSTIMDARVGREISGTVQAAIESGRIGKPVDV
ncbi:MAG: Gfo/Idh/MocA family oxidoreductase, partial [Verrucomicrobiota bacterium]|nr:Gfo/Idh/MocA family oxidoreductase [Verrucomicrobiota bacterium]